VSSALLTGGPEEYPRETPENRFLKEAYGDEQRLQDLAGDLNAQGHQKAANTVERFLPGLMSYTVFPKQHPKRILTPNLVESVNRGLKRKTKVVETFPNEELLLRPVV